MSVKLDVQIDGMHCISCSSSIEKAVKKVPGVVSVSIDYALGMGTIQMVPRTPPEKILKAIQEAGYHGEIIDQRKIHTFASVAPFYNNPQFINFFISFLLTLPLLIHMLGEMFNPSLSISPYVSLIFATIVQFWCGRSLYKGAWSSLKAFAPNMDILIVIGSLTSYIFSCILLFTGDLHLYFETGAFIITVVLFGRWIEGESKEKARTALYRIMELRPKKVHVEREGQFLEIDPYDLRMGEEFFIPAGELVAVDGVVIDGSSWIDEEILFGEKVPVGKQIGDRVYAGTLNLEGTLKAKAEKVGKETLFEHMVERAKKLHTTKAPIQKLADQVAEVFVPAILLTGVVVFFSWWIATDDIVSAILPAISTIIIACPCAIGMATPVALLAASSLSSKNGILFHDAHAIESAAKIEFFAFDKTGTLTQGEPSVQKIELFGSMKELEALQILSSLETFSSHPIAKAIVGYAKQSKIDPTPMSQMRNLMGKGIEASQKGQTYFAGSVAYAMEQNIPIPEALKTQEPFTIVVLIHHQQIAAAVYLKDVIRPYAKEVVEALQAKGIEVVLISGDKKLIAEETARKVGIDQVFAEVLPDEKVDTILDLKSRKKILGMCGDGMNDAFALASADVGFSLASGSDFAIESSDVTLMKKDLRGIVDTIDLSSATLRKIKQNLFLASIYNIVAIPLAASGLLNPMIAATAMVASSLSVVLNALHLRKWKPNSFSRS